MKNSQHWMQCKKHTNKIQNFLNSKHKLVVILLNKFGLNAIAAVVFGILKVDVVDEQRELSNGAAVVVATLSVVFVMKLVTLFDLMLLISCP